MIIAEAKRRLGIERQILKLMGDLDPNDMRVWTRVTFQLAYIAELEGFIINAQLHEQLMADEAARKEET